MVTPQLLAVRDPSSQFRQLQQLTKRHKQVGFCLIVLLVVGIVVHQSSTNLSTTKTIPQSGDGAAATRGGAAATTTSGAFWQRSITPATSKREKWVVHTKEAFDSEFSNGRWSYLDGQGTERARHAAIVSVFYNQFGGGAIGPLASKGATGSKEVVKRPPPKRLLDVGCGLGTLSDYLQGAQRQMYLGVDFSDSAVDLARKIRSKGGENTGEDGITPLELDQFLQGNAETFQPPDNKKYGTIVFNEVLYYTDHKHVLERFATQYLEPENGIIVISLYYGVQTDPNIPLVDWLEYQNTSSDSILDDARGMFETVHWIKVNGVVDAGDGTTTQVVFHIEGFRVKQKP